jgi:hypothetical protein
MSRFFDNSVTRYAKVPQVGINSGDTDSGTEVAGVQIDLQDTTGQRFRRCKVSFPYSVTVDTTGTTVSFASNLQHRNTTSGTGSTWADFGTAPSAHVTGGSTTTGASIGAMEYEQDLTLANRYIRVQVTPTFSATTTGLALLTYSGVVELKDPNRYPGVMTETVP